MAKPQRSVGVSNSTNPEKRHCNDANCPERNTTVTVNGLDVRDGHLDCMRNGCSGRLVKF